MGSVPGRLSLRQNFSWTFLGNSVHAACQWGVLVVLAKLGRTELVGQYALGLAINAPIFMFMNLQLRGVQATDVRTEFTFVDYRSLRYVTTALGLVMVASVILVSNFDRSTALVVLFVGLAKAFDSLSDVYYGFAQKHERMDLIARSLIYKGVFSLVAMAILMFATGSVIWATAGVAVAWLLRFVTYDARLTSMLPERTSTHGWDWSRSAALVKVAFPLGLVMLLVSLGTNIPRYVIQHELGERAVGLYSAIAYLVVAGTVIVNALGQAASPKLARQYAKGDIPAFKQMLGQLVLVAVGLGTLGILASIIGGKSLLALIYTDEYASRVDLLSLFMIAALVQYTASFLGYGMTAARRFGLQLPLALVGTLITLGASIILIPKHGLTGAVIAVILAAVVNIFGAAGINLVAIRMRTKKALE